MPLTFVLTANCCFGLGCPFPFLPLPFMISCVLTDVALVPLDMVVFGPELAMMEDGLRMEGLEVAEGEGIGGLRFAGSMMDCGALNSDWDSSEGESQVVAKVQLAEG